MRARAVRCVLAALMLAVSLFSFVSCAAKEGPVDNTTALPETSQITDLTDARYVNLYGRNFYNENLEGMTFVNSVSGFEVRFSGTMLEMRVQIITTGAAGYDKSMFSVFVDGETDSNANVLTMAKTVGVFERYVVAQGLAEGEHTIRVLKRTPSNRERCIVGSIATDGTFLAAPPTPEIRLDVYGDSITCGEGVMREVTYDAATGRYTDSAVYTADTQNVFQSYAGAAARELGAELRVFGRGGIALKYKRPTDDFCVLDNYRSMAVDLSVERGECPEYDYNSWKPSAVVIYLGTNDYNIGRAYPQVGYSDSGMAYAVVQFINEVVGPYYGKDMPVFLCSGMMVPDSGLDACMEEAKRILGAEYPNIVTVEFEAGITAPGGHPVVEESDRAGKQLAAAIRAVLENLS